MNEDDIVWLLCKCYVWPTYYWSILGRDWDNQGSCGRCGGRCVKLSNLITTRQEALEVFFETQGFYPEPIKSN